MLRGRNCIEPRVSDMVHIPITVGIVQVNTNYLSTYRSLFITLSLEGLANAIVLAMIRSSYLHSPGPADTTAVPRFLMCAFCRHVQFFFVFVKSRIYSVQSPGRGLRTVKANAWSDYEDQK